jgi:hypothetical protein
MRTEKPESPGDGHIYAPTIFNRWLLALMLVPGILMIGWCGTYVISENSQSAGLLSVGLGFLAAAVAAAIFLLHITTLRVRLTDHEITRTWTLGSCNVSISKITKLEWSSSKGQLILTLHADSFSFMLSSLSLREAELREVASAILKTRGLEGYPLLPRYSSTCIDVELMSKRYLRPGATHQPAAP